MIEIALSLMFAGFVAGGASGYLFGEWINRPVIEAQMDLARLEAEHATQTQAGQAPGSSSFSTGRPWYHGPSGKPPPIYPYWRARPAPSCTPYGPPAPFSPSALDER